MLIDQEIAVVTLGWCLWPQAK